MKKILALILAALMILCFVACSQEPENEGEEEESSATGTANEVDVFEKADEDDDDEPRKVGVAVYDLDEDGHYEITSYKPSSVEVVDIVLPDKAPDGREIVAIGAEAFKAQNSIRSLEIPATYEKIGKHAFYECDGLVSVSMADSVVEIEDGAFHKCAKLESFTGAAAVKTVGQDAFSDCIALKAIDLSGAVEVINTAAFRGCTALKTVTVSNNVTFIEKYAFNDCTSLKYEIADGAKYLGNSQNKFVALISIDDLYTSACIINDSTKLIAKNAFSNCPALESVTVGNGIKVIDSDCFVNTPRLTYNVYEDVSYLGTKDNPYAIAMTANVPSATGIQLHKDVKMIAGDAFEKCVNLTDIDCSQITKEAWEGIYKAEGWNRDLILKIYCSDEVIELN